MPDALRAGTRPRRDRRMRYQGQCYRRAGLFLMDAVDAAEGTVTLVHGSTVGGSGAARVGGD